MEIWDLWYPNAAARGISFGRGALDHTDCLLLHAAPPELRVEVRDDVGRQLAFGDQLVRQGPAALPMTLLIREGGAIRREDRWPGPPDIGLPVMLPGGEVGILRDWWHAPDGSEWRWSVEFYNHR